ncbi:MAG TPA: hypothetical protein VGB96_15095 [Archangium sp.]
MTFILTDERDDDPEGSFDRYREYLERERHRFPPSAHALATSGWYYGTEHHGAPHDAWLEALEITEPSSGARHEERVVTMKVRLLGAYHDGIIEMRYPLVFGYRLDFFPGPGSHGDWRYDEFEVNRAGRLIHTIEWFGAGESGAWRIEASDVEHKWTPFER